MINLKMTFSMRTQTVHKIKKNVEAYRMQNF